MIENSIAMIPDPWSKLSHRVIQCFLEFMIQMVNNIFNLHLRHSLIASKQGVFQFGKPGAANQEYRFVLDSNIWFNPGRIIEAFP